MNVDTLGQVYAQVFKQVGSHLKSKTDNLKRTVACKIGIQLDSVLELPVGLYLFFFDTDDQY